MEKWRNGQRVKQKRGKEIFFFVFCPYYPLIHFPFYPQPSALNHCHPFHTSGRYPTVAALPLRTIGVQNNNGSSSNNASIFAALNEACASPFSTKCALNRSMS